MYILSDCSCLVFRLPLIESLPHPFLSPSLSLVRSSLFLSAFMRNPGREMHCAVSRWWARSMKLVTYFHDNTFKKTHIELWAESHEISQICWQRISNTFPHFHINEPKCKRILALFQCLLFLAFSFTIEFMMSRIKKQDRGRSLGIQKFYDKPATPRIKISTYSRLSQIFITRDKNGGSVRVGILIRPRTQKRLGTRNTPKRLCRSKEGTPFLSLFCDII